MDDLSKKIEALLNDPAGMSRIQSMLGAFSNAGEAGGAGGADSVSDADSAGGASLLSGLGSLFGGATPAEPSGGSGGLGGLGGLLPEGLDLSMLMKLAPLLGGMGKEDQNTVLLRALRPYLHGDRVKRLDDAIQMLRLTQFLPLLQTLGKKEEPHG